MKQYQHPTADQITLTGVLHALSDPVRLNYVQCLAQSIGEQACGTVPTSVAKSTMSHHIRVLREAGIIHIRPYGTQSLISLRSDELEKKFPGVFTSVLTAAKSSDVVELP
ncbi:MULTISPECIES: helix-turn-helix transcriptional regulator [unclassified Spirosoma]|uniref:ArsR/SmtB family transcription factor n=1 Tax=unclassified Spirosoma TaxID=2621999 RepID=UPI00095BF2D9|nr:MULTISPECIES: helix-turn-helix transcriptional regulator [unclassified Spirosoma]MBN8825678.1 helix-turn-helix transcriptional regulator [Spirosoma sp.]OJW76628.1 MAG: transcriptional regulator [Spirosoma sp. 48-14]